MRARTSISLMVALGGLVGLWGSASHAQTTPGSTWGGGGLSPSQSYLGLNIGKSQFDPDCVANLTCDNGKTAFKLTAGSITTDILGAEISYLNMGKIGYAGGSQKAQGLNLSLVGNLPVSAAFTAFGKIGTTYRLDRHFLEPSGHPHRHRERLRPELRHRAGLQADATARDHGGIRAAQLRLRARGPDARPDVGGIRYGTATSRRSCWTQTARTT